MNFKFPSSLDNNPPNPNYNGNPNSSYFTQQAIRAGYANDDVNRREINGFTATSDVRRHELERYTTESDVRRREFDYSSKPVDVIGSNPVDVRGSMEREMAKERIRAEIIAEENMRNRLLEDEVRRELMRERELGFRHRDFGIGGSTGFIRMDPFARNYEHRDRGGSSGGSGVWSHREVEYGVGFNTMPYNRDYRDYRVARGSGSGVSIHEIKEVDRDVHPHGVSKDKAIVLAKSSANLAYLKRKTMMPPVGGAAEVFKKQKTKEHWRCALCQVTATSERGLKDHFQGKKHQANEKGIVPHRTGFGTEPLPNTVSSSAVKPLTLLSIPSTSNVKKNGKQHGESSLAKADRAPSRNATLPSLKLKKTGKALATGIKGKQKKVLHFFCEVCQVGANSMIVFDAHKKGKKHLANLSVPNKTIEAVPNTKFTLVKSKGTSSKRVNREAKCPVSGKRVKPKKKFEYFCSMCQVGSNSLTVFDAHKNGKKHLAKLSALKVSDGSVQVEASTQKAPSSTEKFDSDFKEEEETSGGNFDGDEKEETEEIGEENFEGDVKEEVDEIGEEDFEGEEFDETGEEDLDDEELDETGGVDFDDDVEGELEETGGENFDGDDKEGVEETGAESFDCDVSRPEGVETVMETCGGETLAPISPSK
ncbi:hypothetical protein KSS87_016399 [Heliosperma pusillum]|nr:hypothetical protein KSS87_016399 [Heliosperma pusillum]